MAIGRADFDNIAEADLTELITNGVGEGITLDLKQTVYARSDSDKSEFLKDVSSFANMHGGHLILGMNEDRGIASAITPISGINIDEEVQRLESLLRDGLQPRVVGYRIRNVAVTDGHVIVIRIPRSWSQPHRVSARGANSYWLRNSSGKHEASVDELRILFTGSFTILERIRLFRQERLAKVNDGSAPVTLTREPGRLFVHIVPLGAFGIAPSIDLGKAERMQTEFRPMGMMGGARINFDGVLFHSQREKSDSYTQLFRNGCLESVLDGIIKHRENCRLIPALKFEKDLIDDISGYINGLKTLNVPAPLVVMVTIDGIKKCWLAVSDDYGAFRGSPIMETTLDLPEVLIENYGSEIDFQRALCPAFNSLWNAAGHPKSEYFTETGEWRGKPHR